MLTRNISPEGSPSRAPYFLPDTHISVMTKKINHACEIPMREDDGVTQGSLSARPKAHFADPARMRARRSAAARAALSA